MDIAALSIAKAQTQVKADASMKVMSNVKDLLNQQGDQLLEMLETSSPAPHPSLGNKIDLNA
ncbi:YjfB family protein [Virgibacillus sp. MSJ-26]|uniref:YjfB family protein n=1 Tax=Virgibacillus sp. MSJ-26 TaxID=2841522 RepID=UPI001C107879|nr:YjfB family protein [Virgibacillus sp. MSJ-26]MBU5465296.1 YjfB family protein [Virgibacillus sp. MSJ-26]